MQSGPMTYVHCHCRCKSAHELVQQSLPYGANPADISMMTGQVVGLCSWYLSKALAACNVGLQLRQLATCLESHEVEGAHVTLEP